jgi:hypothetical protein
VSRAGHYGFERRRRADIQKAKQEAKRQRKTERAESGVTGRTVTSRPGTRPEPDEPNDWILLTDVEPDARPD